MTQLTRGWLACAAFGAGVIHLALVLGSPAPVASALGVIGAAEFGWGAVALSRDRIPFPRVTVFAAIAPVVGWALLVVLATALDSPGLASGVTVVPMGVACVFDLAIAAIVGRHLREPRRDVSVRPARYFLGMAAGALVITAIVAPTLALTQAGPASSRTAHYQFSDPGHAGH